MILHLTAAIGLWMLGGGNARAAPRVVVDSGAQRVASDRVVTIRWSGLPADARECELLLEVDGGRGRLRITGELDPRAGSYRWAVPNVPVRRARVVLRLNVRGREVEAPSSDPFEIAAADEAPRAAVFERSGEIWLMEDRAEEDDREPELPSRLAAPAAVFVAAVVEHPAALPPSSARVENAPPGPGPSPSASIEACGLARPVFGLSALFVPPRI